MMRSPIATPYPTVTGEISTSTSSPPPSFREPTVTCGTGVLMTHLASPPLPIGPPMRRKIDQISVVITNRSSRNFHVRRRFARPPPTARPTSASTNAPRAGSGWLNVSATANPSTNPTTFVTGCSRCSGDSRSTYRKTDMASHSLALTTRPNSSGDSSVTPNSACDSSAVAVGRKCASASASALANTSRVGPSAMTFPCAMTTTRCA